MTIDNYTTQLQAIPFGPVSVSSTLGASFFDIMTISAGASDRFELHEVNIGQRSTANNAGGVQYDVSLIRGTSGSSAPGATLNPANTKGWAGVSTAQMTATGLTTVLASTTPAGCQLIYQDNADISGNWFYRPDVGEEFTMDYSQNLTIRITAPPATITMSGTVLVRGLGKQR